MSTTSSRLGVFLVGRPELVARLRELQRDRLHVGDEPVERGAQAQVLAQRLLVPVRPDVLDHLIGVVAGLLGLLADQRLDVVVGDLDPGLVGDRLERELAGDRPRGLGLHLRDQRLGRLPGDLEVRGGLDPAPAERADEAVEQLTRPRLDERAGALDVRGGDERVDGGRPEGGVDLLLDRGADAPLDVGPQLGERVELAGGARELVVELRQHLLVDVLDRDRDRGAGLVGELVVDLLRLPDARADQRRLDLLDEPAGAELDDRVGLRLARGALQVDDERVALLGRTVVGGHELGDALPQRLELLVDELLRNLGLGARHLERRPVDDLGRGLHLDRGRERPRLLVGRRQLEVVLRAPRSAAGACATRPTRTSR